MHEQAHGMDLNFLLEGIPVSPGRVPIAIRRSRPNCRTAPISKRHLYSVCCCFTVKYLATKIYFRSVNLPEGKTVAIGKRHLDRLTVKVLPTAKSGYHGRLVRISGRGWWVFGENVAACGPGYPGPQAMALIAMESPRRHGRLAALPRRWCCQPGWRRGRRCRPRPWWR